VVFLSASPKRFAGQIAARKDSNARLDVLEEVGKCEMKLSESRAFVGFLFSFCATRRFSLSRCSVRRRDQIAAKIAGRAGRKIAIKVVGVAAWRGRLRAPVRRPIERTRPHRFEVGLPSADSTRAQRRDVYVDPVVPPIDGFRRKAKSSRSSGGQSRGKVARVFTFEDMLVVENEWFIQLISFSARIRSARPASGGFFMPSVTPRG